MGLARGTAAALSRSLRVYYGGADRRRAMDALYGRFLKPGDLAFDIGAHVGDRTACFRRLGARVVALEPQPGPARVLRLIHGRDAGVSLLAAAAGDRDGPIRLHLNSANPTVATASEAFMRAADGAVGWQEEVWDDATTVPCLTLDRLVREHGTPRFIKIDVEGFEARVLSGLTRAVAALSFEFTTIARDVAGACLERLVELGPYRFNLALGETHALLLPEFVDAPAMALILAELPHDANSGDVYAVLAP